MSDDAPTEIDRTKIRIGLAMIGIVVVAAMIGVAVIDAGAGKALMFAIVVLGLVRLFLLTRSLRQESAGS